MLRSADALGANHLFVDGTTPIEDLELGDIDQAPQVETGAHVRVLTDPKEVAFYLSRFLSSEVGSQTLRLELADPDKTDVAELAEGLPPVRDWPTEEPETFDPTAYATTTYVSPVPQPVK